MSYLIVWRSYQDAFIVVLEHWIIYTHNTLVKHKSYFISSNSIISQDNFLYKLRDELHINKYEKHTEFASYFNYLMLIHFHTYPMRQSYFYHEKILTVATCKVTDEIWILNQSRNYLGTSILTANNRNSLIELI